MCVCEDEFIKYVLSVSVGGTLKEYSSRIDVGLCRKIMDVLLSSIFPYMYVF
jgi:hypothetical protein